jgi:ribose transport system substrate-binding protein
LETWEEKESALASNEDDRLMGDLSRRQLLRRGMQAGAVFSASGLIAACGSSGDKGGGSKTTAKKQIAKTDVLKGLPVVALFTTLENDYYAGWDQGGRRAVEALGGKYRAFTNDNDPTKEVATFQNQIQAGAKIVFMTAPDPSNIPKIAELANQNKVFVVNTWESPQWYSPFSAGPYYVTYITNNSFEAGKTIAKALFDKMGGKGGLVHISGFPGSTPDWQRTAGLHEALKEYPNIKLLASQPGKWNRDDSRNAMAGIIRKVGKDNINGVFGQNDDCGVGAMNALQEAGVDLSKVPITGCDGNKGTMDFIKAGRYFAAYSSLPWWSAGFSAVRAIDAYKGVKFEPAERQLWSGGLVVTKDTADGYLKTFAQSDPFDWARMSRFLHPKDWDPQNAVTPMDMNVMWGGQKKPSGFELPADYAAAVKTDELKKVAELYASQYQKKISV